MLQRNIFYWVKFDSHWGMNYRSWSLSQGVCLKSMLRTITIHGLTISYYYWRHSVKCKIKCILLTEEHKSWNAMSRQAESRWDKNSNHPLLFQWHSQDVKKLRTSKGDYWIKQWFSSIASLFIMGTSLKRKEFAPRGSELSSFKSSSLWHGNHFCHMWPPLNVTIFYYARA